MTDTSGAVNEAFLAQTEGATKAGDLRWKRAGEK